MTTCIKCGQPIPDGDGGNPGASQSFYMVRVDV